MTVKAVAPTFINQKELAMATSKLFKGKETTKEEKGEAKALKSGKISVAQYMKGEKSEGEKPSKKTAMAIKSGKMSPAQYAKQDKKEKK